MRLAFMGSPDFAVPALRALHQHGHEIAAVYCQPARPAGRGQKLRPAPVAAAAEALGLEVRTPARLRRDAAEHAYFGSLNLDAAVIAAYGLILPEAMLGAPKRGCLNIHASLLPRWRGASPIQAAILAGDTETGITVMQMDAGLDTGAMLLREAVPITGETTSADLHDELSAIGARLILRALDEMPPPIPQPDFGATYAPKLSREDGRLDWTESASTLDRRIRALNPWPGTFSMVSGETIKIFSAIPEPDARGAPGLALDAALLVGTGSGGLRITRLQAPGRAPMDAGSFLRGRPIAPGSRFG